MNEKDSKNLLARLVPICLKKGKFLLRSGRTSERYFNMRPALGDPALLNPLADMLWEKMDSSTSCVVGYGLGGRTLAAIISSRHGPKLTLIRDKAKDHGMSDLIEGYIPQAHDILSIPDDVFTTGSSLLEATKIIDPHCRNIAGYAVITHREETDPQVALSGKRFEYLYTAKDFLELEHLAPIDYKSIADFEARENKGI